MWCRGCSPRRRRYPPGSASTAGSGGLLLDLRQLLGGHPELFRDLVGLVLLLFLRHVHSRSVVISLLGRGLFFVARYAGDGLAPSPL
jgi:hypothetical protein